MMETVSLSQLLASNPLAATQAAIVQTIRTLMSGVEVTGHPGKVDLSELVAKAVVRAPGIGIGWTRVREAGMSDGHMLFTVEWVAYIVAEASAATGRRVEKEAVGLAIGARLLMILGDETAPFWGLRAILPPDDKPAPELKPLFTIKDASQGTAYYTVTWSQVIADLGRSYFPDDTGTADPENGLIGYGSAAAIENIAPWVPAEEEPDA